jgi:hypothetical protein
VTVVVLPLYMATAHCNVTGETDAARRSEIGWDVDASYYCVVPEWRNRFGRHYSPAAFVKKRCIARPSRLGCGCGFIRWWAGKRYTAISGFVGC